MTGKKQALEELLQGFTLKFGDSAENRAIISSEISKFMKNREKIAIKDLDNLEELLLYKLTPVKKQLRRFSLSPIPTKQTNFPSPTLKIIKPALSPTPNRSTSIQNSSDMRNKIHLLPKFKRKDSQLFPSAAVPEYLYSKTSSNYSSLSPGRRTIKHVNDHWGKIARAESIKYQQEVQLSMRSGKEQQLEYWMELERQVQENKKKKEKMKNEKEIEVKLLGNRISEYEKQVIENRANKNQKKLKDFEDYKKCLEVAQHRKLKKKETIKTDKAFLETVLTSVNDEKRLKIEEKERINKEIEAENLNRALHKKLLKKEEKIQDSQKDLIHLMQVEKDLTENEIRYKEKIREKVELVHDDQRLFKFYPGQKSLKEYEEEANYKEKMNILKVIQEDEELRLKKIQDKVKNVEVVAGVLMKQVKESEEKKKEFKDYIKEQGEIWKQEDEEVRERNERKRLMRKIKQKEIKEELDRQVREKEERSCSELRLNLNESKINKEIYKSAVKVLGED